jgi:hypothetical protein
MSIAVRNRLEGPAIAASLATTPGVCLAHAHVAWIG